MKKNFLIFIFLLSIILITSCTSGYKINKYEALQLTIDNLEYSYDAKIYYYDNLIDVENLNCSNLSNYNSEYFKNNSLLLITLVDNNDNYYYINDMVINNAIAIYKNNDDIYEPINWTLILEVNGKINDPVNLYTNFADRANHLHSYKEEIIYPTCQEEGCTLYQCMTCGHTYKDNFVDNVECHFENGKCIYCDKDEINVKYKLSVKSDYLSELSLSVDYNFWGDLYVGLCPGSSSLYRLKETDKVNEINIMNMNSSFDDYYTCAYLDMDLKKDLDALPEYLVLQFEKTYDLYFWGVWSGIDFYLAKLYVYTMSNYKDGWYPFYTEHLKWYEIPKNQEIPNEIDNKFLVAITESKDIAITNLEGEELQVFKGYFEAKHLYNNSQIFPQYEEYYNDWINQKYLILEKNNYLYIWDNITDGYHFYIYLRAHSLLIKEIDNIEYLRFLFYSEWGEEDLNQYFEYIDSIYYDEFTNIEIPCTFIKFQDIYNLLNGE